MSGGAIRRGLRSWASGGARELVAEARVRGGVGHGRVPVDEASLPELRGHFPGRPIVPAVMILAAMFEVAARVAAPAEIDVRAVSAARFASPVTPADVELRIDVRRSAGDTCAFEAAAWVKRDGARVDVASAEFQAELRGGRGDS